MEIVINTKRCPFREPGDKCELLVIGNCYESHISTSCPIAIYGTVLPKGHGRLIDADALLVTLRKAKSFGELTAKKAIRLVEEAPAIDAGPVRHGSWVGIDDYPHETWECNICGHVEETLYDPPRYCPFCGAHMDLKETEYAEEEANI